MARVPVAAFSLMAQKLNIFPKQTAHRQNVCFKSTDNDPSCKPMNFTFYVKGNYN